MVQILPNYHWLNFADSAHHIKEFCEICWNGEFWAEAILQKQLLGSAHAWFEPMVIEFWPLDLNASGKRAKILF